MLAWVRSAFPASLAPHVARVTARLGVHEPTRSPDAIPIIVDGEHLSLPGRIYGDAASLIGSKDIPELERLILMSLFTRHDNGHVREQCLRAIVDRPEPWIVPFVVQLVGEYVLEIIDVIRARLADLPAPTYGAFVAANAGFMALTRKRAISYWNAYYRHRFRDCASYPGLVVLNHLESLGGAAEPVAPAERIAAAGSTSPKRSSLAYELWRRDLHHRPSHRAILTDKLLITPERSTFLTRLEPASGTPRWSTKILNPWGWLAHDSERVYYLNQHALMQCHALDDGKMRWTAELPGIHGWLVPAGRVVVVGGWRGYTPLSALDAATGELVWRGEPTGERLAEPVAGPWGLAVASLDAPLVRFLDPTSGALQGEAPLPAHGQQPDATPLLRRAGDRLLLAARDGRYLSLASPSSGWEVLFTHPTEIHTTAPPIVDDAAIFMDMRGQLSCYGLLRSDLRWSLPWRHQRRDLLPVARSPRGLWAIGGSDGRVSVLDPTGRVLWSKVIAKRIQTDLAWLDDQTFVVGTMTALTAIRPEL